MVNDPTHTFEKLISGTITPTKPEEAKEYDYTLGTIYALICALGSACVALCMRYMKDIHYTISPFWFSAGSSFQSMLLYVLYMGPSHANKMTTVYDLHTIALILLESVLAFVAQNFMSRSFQLEKVSILAPLVYM